MNNPCHDKRRHTDATAKRDGIVLVVVMVVVVMISLAGFGFVASMSNENKSVHLRGEQLQMENAVLSAEEFLKKQVQSSREVDDSLIPNSMSKSDIDPETLMRGVVVSDEDGPHGRVRFTVIAPQYDETGFAPWKYGAARESMRLDLHVVMNLELGRPGTGRKALMGLPGMTDAIADALLDWMDSDTTPRESGAERDYYASLNPPYLPRNGIPDSLEELLLIKGVTRTLLFGRDANQNHRLDYEELNAMNATTSRESTGERQLPWAELLTLYSGERNETRDGEPRINLNDFDLMTLHRKLNMTFDPNFATFVILYRQFGPSMGNLPSGDVSKIQINFANPPKYSIRSPLDLLQARVPVLGAGGTITTVSSPLPREPEKLDEVLGILYDRVTVSNSQILRGRVNLNLAPVEVLSAIPGIDKALAEQIVTSRSTGTKDVQKHEKHPCWLFTEGLVDLNKMTEIYPHLTIGGDIYRAQIVAFSEASRLSQRVEIVLDATGKSTRRLFWKDLQVLGRGYPWDVIDTPGGFSAAPSGAFDATSFSN